MERGLMGGGIFKMLETLWNWVNPALNQETQVIFKAIIMTLIIADNLVTCNMFFF